MKAGVALGDIVFHKTWKLCLYEIVALDCGGSHGRIRLRLLGGRAVPAGLGEEFECSWDWVEQAENRLNAMEILALASMEPTQ